MRSSTRGWTSGWTARSRSGPRRNGRRTASSGPSWCQGLTRPCTLKAVCTSDRDSAQKFRNECSAKQPRQRRLVSQSPTSSLEGFGSLVSRFLFLLPLLSPPRRSTTASAQLYLEEAPVELQRLFEVVYLQDDMVEPHQSRAGRHASTIRRGDPRRCSALNRAGALTAVAGPFAPWPPGRRCRPSPATAASPAVRRPLRGGRAARRPPARCRR